MSKSEDLSTWMSEIGPLMGLEAVFENEEKVSWSLVLADGLEMLCHYNEQDDRLTLTGDILFIGNRPDPALLTMLLQYNAASTETGGVRLALDEGNTVLHIFDTPIANLTIHNFKDIILALAEKIIAWREALHDRLQKSAGDTGLPSSSDDEMMIKI